LLYKHYVQIIKTDGSLTSSDRNNVCSFFETRCSYNACQISSPNSKC